MKHSLNGQNEAVSSLPQLAMWWVDLRQAPSIMSGHNNTNCCQFQGHCPIFRSIGICTFSLLNRACSKTLCIIAIHTQYIVLQRCILVEIAKIGFSMGEMFFISIRSVFLEEFTTKILLTPPGFNLVSHQVSKSQKENSWDLEGKHQQQLQSTQSFNPIYLSLDIQDQTTKHSQLDNSISNDLQVWSTPFTGLSVIMNYPPKYQGLQGVIQHDMLVTITHYTATLKVGFTYLGLASALCV